MPWAKQTCNSTSSFLCSTKEAAWAKQSIIVQKTHAKDREEAKSIAKGFSDRMYTSRETGTSYRFRQKHPKHFVPGTFRVKSIPKKGVTIVYGELEKTAFEVGFEKNAMSAKGLRLLEAGTGALVGGGLGAGTGAAVDSDHRLRGALIGGLAGAGLGGVGAAGASALIRGKKKINILRTTKPTAEDMPTTYYHGAPEHLNTNIAKEGLKPNAYKNPKQHPSEKGRQYPNHVFLTKDESYAKAYGKSNKEGIVDLNIRPNVKHVVLPQGYKGNIKNIMETPRPDLSEVNNGADLSGVGTFGVRNKPILGMGSEFAHEGPIPKRFVADSAQEADKLRSHFINRAVQRRQIKQIKDVENKFFGVK